MTIGFDTEFALIKPERMGDIINNNTPTISSVGLIGGTKKNPIKVSDKFKENQGISYTYRGYMLQEDNVFVEINTPIAGNHNDLSRILKEQLELANIVAKQVKCLARFKSYVFLEKKYLETEQSQTFGCDPDFNAWSGKINESPQRETTLRTMGCHIHIGYDNPKIEHNIKIVKLLDITLGALSISKDSQKERMFLYGKPGAFRPKDYGVEYRFLPSSIIPLFLYNGNESVLPENLNDHREVSLRIKLLYDLIHSIVNFEGEIEDIINPATLRLLRILMEMNDSLGVHDILVSIPYNKFLTKLTKCNDMRALIN